MFNCHLQIYKNYTDRVNVLIGKAHGNENFFKIQTFNERPTVTGFYPEQGDCFASLVNSTEGALYPQFLKKETVLWYWRKTLCRTVPLYYEKEVKLGSVVGYKYGLKDDTFDRLENASQDCFKGKSVLPSGLSDLSRCFFGKFYKMHVKIFHKNFLVVFRSTFGSIKSTFLQS